MKQRKKKEMNKIHNNLIIENLIRTEYFKKLDKDKKEEIVINSEWFNQFNRNQQEEILEGLKYNLDVSWYANPEFNSLQIVQIKLGLIQYLDVSVYAKPEINWMKMNRMRDELLKKQIG